MDAQATPASELEMAPILPSAPARSRWPSRPATLARRSARKARTGSATSIPGLRCTLRREPCGRSSVRERIGRYVVLGELGHGGMGVVLEAFDRTLDRRVALKVLHRDLDEAHTKRLLREAQALAKLSHPNVVQVYEVGEAEGQTFIAMELVKGRSINAWLSQEPRPGWQECVKVQRALEIFERALGPGHPRVAELLDSLGALHRARDELDARLAEHPTP